MNTCSSKFAINCERDYCRECVNKVGRGVRIVIRIFASIDSKYGYECDECNDKFVFRMCCELHPPTVCVYCDVVYCEEIAMLSGKKCAFARWMR
jgi:hypothetical protein